MGGRKQSVLLVEDHPDLLKAMTECVEGLGLEPIEAADGRTAMNRLAGECPDLVCLDVVLPESSGYEVCGFIRRTPHLRNVPVLMMSGRGMPAEGAYAEEAGADDFLTKPFSREDFRKRVEHLLRARNTVQLRDGEGEGR